MDTQLSTERSTIQISQSIKRYKKQRFWQIFLPVGMISLIIIAGIILIIVFGLKDTISLGQVSDTALIWLIAPGLFFALIAVLLLGGLIYLITRLIGVLPRYTGMAQNYVGLVPVFVKKWTDKSVSPILVVESASAKIIKFCSILLNRSTK